MFAKNLLVRSTKTAAVLLSSAVLFVAPGCGSEAEDEPVDMGHRRDTSGANNGTPTWETGVIETGAMGLHPKIARSSNGVIGAAYYSLTGRDDGDCTDMPDVEMPPPQVYWTMKYATLSGDAWSVEQIAEPRFVGSPPGLDLKFLGEDPLVAGMAGDPLPMFLYCGVNDAALYRRQSAGNWMSETAVAGSAEAPVGDPASDFGAVVGYWPALGVSSTGELAIAYKDVHGGGLQSDDFRKADLEIAFSNGGGWNAVAVDPTRGAGNFTEMLYDAQDRPVVAQYNQTEAPGFQPGVFLHRSSDQGANWETIQVFANPTLDGPSLALSPTDGTLWVAYYQSQRGFPQVAHVIDETKFESASEGWAFEDVGDSRFDEGYGTSIAVSDAGQVALAYYRCTTATAGLGDCNSNDDGLIFTYRNGEDSWTQEKVVEGDLGACGMAPSLVWDSSNRPIIIYRCEVDTGNGFDTQLHWARRSTAP